MVLGSTLNTSLVSRSVFYRVDSARSRQTGGTGLGLAIVKHVLMQHGAHLEITSKENEGSTFTAVFPKERLYHMI